MADEPLVTYELVPRHVHCHACGKTAKHQTTPKDWRKFVCECGADTYISQRFGQGPSDGSPDEWHPKDYFSSLKPPA